MLQTVFSKNWAEFYPWVHTCFLETLVKPGHQWLVACKLDPLGKKKNIERRIIE